MTPYVLATALDGSVGVRGFDADVDSSFSDIVEKLNGAPMLTAELRKGRFALLSDTFLARLEGDKSAARGGNLANADLDLDAKMTQVIQQLAGTYWLGTWQLAPSEPGRPFDVTAICRCRSGPRSAPPVAASASSSITTMGRANTPTTATAMSAVSTRRATPPPPPAGSWSR